ncbi:ribonuclease H1-like [Bombyx mori]|uniref:ribonuclease H n=1 Tax=Bombyx mori TaxID=7091 RepID=A0A8R2M179_BOMMO|nr:ribonuclease H1-like [Bombyx mori]
MKKGVTSLAGREVERVVAFADTPHPAEHTTMEFVSLVDQSHVETHNSQDVRFFTDGSRIEGKVGAALSLWDREAEIKSSKLSLPSCCTVYQAELLAICVATRQILRRGEGAFGIYSDSKAALQTVTNQSALHALAVEARANLDMALSQGKDISLFWIKAHAGLEGNERADHLAKEVALKRKTKPDYDLCPVSFVRRQIRLESLAE